MKMKAGSNSSKRKDDAGAVDRFLSKVPEPGRSTLQKLRGIIRSAAPKEATEGLSYGMPAFKYKGSLVCYSAFKDHCSFFPMSGKLVEEHKEQLEKFDTSKGTIKFPLDKCLPADVVKKMVKARVAQQDAK